MVVETWFQANTLKKDSRTRSICNCVAPLLTVRFVKTTDASRHFAACACVCLGNRNELPHFCCIQTLIQARNATSCCSFCFVRNFCKDNCLGYVYFLPLALVHFSAALLQRHRGATSFLFALYNLLISSYKLFSVINVPLVYIICSYETLWNHFSLI